LSQKLAYLLVIYPDIEDRRISSGRSGVGHI